MKNVLFTIGILCMAILLTAQTPPNWYFSNTGNNHVVLIPATTTFSIMGNDIETGDYIGAFYDSLGSLACAGYTVWNGGTNAVTTWGSQSGLVDGMALGEEIKWKVFDVSEGTEYQVIAGYDTVSFQHAQYYTVNGLSGLISLILENTGPAWSYSITGDLHTLLIPSITSITIDGYPIAVGDYIGVFYDSSGFLACGGYNKWTGNNIALTAWADDPFTTSPDGFANGEPFKWKIWRSTDNQEINGSPSYLQQPIVPDGANFVASGISGLASLEALTIEFQYIALPQGWSLWSTYIDPFQANIDSLCAPFVSQVNIVKTGLGQTYWPQYGLNGIGNIVIGEGYKIRLLSAQTLVVEGISVQPEATPLSLLQGWSFMGYLRQNPAPIDILLGPIESHTIIVKSGNGSTYWPQYQINTIGTMTPGMGYQIKMVSQQTLTYPANFITL